jgi:hypothetical protein
MSDDHSNEPQKGQSKGSKSPDYIGYAVRNRGEDKEAGWTRVGAAWNHEDGKGMTLQMEATPVDGRVTLREFRKEAFKEKRREGQLQSQAQRQSREPSQER